MSGSDNPPGGSQHASEITQADHANIAMNRFVAGVRNYTSFLQTHDIKDIENASREIRSAIPIAENETGKDQMRFMLGQIGLKFNERYSQTNLLEYLEKAIEATKATELQGAYRAQLLNQLGSLLGSLFIRTDQQEILDEAIRITKQALSCTVEDPMNHGTALINLCNRLSERWKHTGLASHLDEAIDFGRRAMEETHHPQQEALQTNIAGNLGVTLCERFSTAKDPADLEEGINLCAIAVMRAARDDPNRARWQNNMGMAYSHRYSLLNDISDLNQAIDITEEGLRAVNQNSLLRNEMVLNLALWLQDRFLAMGIMSDLDRAIQNLSSILIPHVVGASEKQQAERSRRLTLLGVSFGHRFKKTKQASDIDASVRLLKESLEALPPSCLDRGIRLENMSSALRGRFLFKESMEDLDEAIDITRRMIGNNIKGALDRSSQLDLLAGDLGLRFTKTNNPVDIDEAIELRRHVVAASSVGDAGHADHLGGLASLLHTRFTASGAAGDLDEAIDLSQKALEITKDSQVRLEISRNLGAFLGRKYTHTGELAHIHEAIQLTKHILEDHTIRDIQRRVFLNHLGNFFIQIYEFSGEMADLDEGIRLTRESTGGASVEEEEQAGRLSNLARALWIRFLRTGQMADIDESIRFSRKAVEGTMSQQSKDRILFTVNLAGLLAERFIRAGNIIDLNEAIDLARQTIPYEHTNRAARLINLATQLNMRFQRTGDTDDLVQAAKFGREAVSTLNYGDSDLPAKLNGISAILTSSYLQWGSIADLNEAVRLDEEGWRKTPSDHRQVATRAVHLATSLGTRYRHNGTQSDLNEARRLYLVAVGASNGEIWMRIVAGRRFLLLTDLEENDAHEAFSVAETTIKLIPMFASLSLKPKDRQQLLSRVATQATDAAALALYVGKSPEHAIDLLETGRGVIAGTLQDFRVDITLLARSDPELARRFAQLRDTLDVPANASVVETSLPIEAGDLPFAFSPFEADRRHEASNEVSSILDEIRQIQGFERFLLAGTEAQVRDAAAHGPIVIINVASYRCDALIIEHTNIRALQLSDLKLEDIKSHHTRVDSVDTLEWLWDVVVGPVLGFLGYTESPHEGQPWPRVWWIPTGGLVRYPLHAAGHHLRRTSETALDRVVSSYSSSVKAMINARRHQLSPGTTSECESNAVLVSMPETPGYMNLRHAKSEVTEVDKVCSLMGVPCEHPNENQQDVLTALRDCRVFHFAGHGDAHPTDPLQSHLLLKDHQSNPLTVGNLFETNLRSRQPFLAYLSACGTGEIQDPRAVDESIHLASAFQLAGFRHVVGSLWNVDDAVCVDVARFTYDAILEHGFEDFSVSLGLPNMTIIEIEVILTLSARWCYIGKRKLDHAISLYQKTYPGGKKDTFSITWKPYYLHYNPYSHSVDKSNVTKLRLNDMSPERQAALTQRMEQIGRSVGVNFKWGGKIGPDTRDAHRLVRLSRDEEASVQSALIDALVAAYHEFE
ncbi:TPR domain-containing protein [Colletotrichum kahawae]|uniref:TPR domain-containing protein n=1 Tax=Colletotrichum kahawae TaxID=34407 RepID=A0AAE0DAV0_COLKA|nr:TPR domain-containing protein [Colletotrichum kahawae]